MFEKVGHEKWSGRKVYHWLKFDLNFHTIGNKPLALGNVYRILSNPFYYGVFEFPRKSGNWYQGKHETLVSKELFDKTQDYEHPTQKPITLGEKPLKRCSSPGDIVLDLFGGSGSTLIAAEQLKRRAFLMELDPTFCDLIIRRWEHFTQNHAKKLT